jgi:protein-S-isoprenylcysteine O-methyltransferase
MERQQTLSSHPLRTIPIPSVTQPHENIPNTPLAVATIAFLLGAVCALGFLTFVVGGFSSYWWSTYQLGFFVAAWAAFHWAEFAVTAGWNLEKCSVDCTLPSLSTFLSLPEKRTLKLFSWTMAPRIILQMDLP